MRAAEGAPLALVSCWRCAGHLLFEPGVVAGLRRAGAGTYCTRCKKIVDAGQARPLARGSRCVHVQYQSGPFSQLIVSSVDGDQVTVFILGFPDREPDYSLRWWPPIMQGRRVFSRGELLATGMFS